MRKLWIAFFAMPRTLCATLTVMAAASLKNAFAALGADYDAQHPATSTTLNFAGLQELARHEQMIQKGIDP